MLLWTSRYIGPMHCRHDLYHTHSWTEPRIQNSVKVVAYTKRWWYSWNVLVIRFVLGDVSCGPILMWHDYRRRVLGVKAVKSTANFPAGVFAQIMTWPAGFILSTRFDSQLLTTATFERWKRVSRICRSLRTAVVNTICSFSRQLPLSETAIR